MLSDCSYTHTHTHDVIVSTSGKFMSPMLMLIQVQQSHTIKKPQLAKLRLCILFASNVQWPFAAKKLGFFLRSPSKQLHTCINVLK